MTVLAAMACAPENRDVEDFLRGQRALREKALNLDGMAIRARDGASRKALDDIVACAMAAWDSVIESHDAV